MKIKHLIVGLLRTNCYLLISGNEMAIIDPGGEAEKILKEIKKTKINPVRKNGALNSTLSRNKNLYSSSCRGMGLSNGVKLKYIINTHYHTDHTLANKKIKKETGTKILIHKKEKEFIDFKADKFLKNKDKIKIGESILQVIHTPGHSQGSICLIGENIAFTGDTLFKDGFGRTGLWGGSQKEIEKSFRKLSIILKPGMKIYPGHGEIWTHKI